MTLMSPGLGEAPSLFGFAISSTVVLTNGTTVFTITGGPIAILFLRADCVTANGAVASTLLYRHTPTVGVAADITAASAALTSFAAGSNVAAQLTAFATPTLASATGVGANIGPTMGGISVSAGSITTTIAGGSSTGTWTPRMVYMALGPNVVVSGV